MYILKLVQRRSPLAVVLLGVAVAAAACDTAPSPGAGSTDPNVPDLPLGDRDGLDMKADNWGHATECKPIPELPTLADPAITISIDGLTLHLVDRAGDYDKVFPIGVGEIDQDAGSLSEGESHTMWPLLHDGVQDFSIKTTDDWNFNACRIWWTDPDSGEELPVFAGLPFMRWRGAYGIHGPITNYHLPSGGNLKRGYVSHGCVRMEADDVLEVYARIRATAKVPVHVQREPERSASEIRVDVEQRWIGAECDSDEVCNFDGGFCKTNELGGRGYCTKACTRYCPDRPWSPETFCVSDDDDPSQGICAIKEQSQNRECRPYDHLAPREAARHGDPSVTARVCLPGSRGWIGDRCLEDADCQEGNRCSAHELGEAGICTRSCDRFCPDLAATPTTFCAAEATLDGPSCLRRCTPASNASECPAGSSCMLRARAGNASVQTYVCVPPQ